jgi:hypothetical protein
MVHSGYEASGVNVTFGSLKGLLATAKAMMTLYPDRGALDLLNQPVAPVHAKNPLVNIQVPQASLEETRA